MIVFGLVLASRFLPVPRWAWIGIPLGKATVSIAAYWLFLRRSFQLRNESGLQALVGATGVALTPLSPAGQIKIRSEIWRARCHDGSRIAEGTAIRIVAIEEERILVESLD